MRRAFIRCRAEHHFRRWDCGWEAYFFWYAAPCAAWRDAGLVHSGPAGLQYAGSPRYLTTVISIPFSLPSRRIDSWASWMAWLPWFRLRRAFIVVFGSRSFWIRGNVGAAILLIFVTMVTFRGYTFNIALSRRHGYTPRRRHEDDDA